MSQKLDAAIAVIGIDIGKNSFHLVGHDSRGAIVLRQKWSRGQVETRLANLPPCLIGMEACVGAHHLSRGLQMFGHDARLMPAKYVRPYSKGQKNDFRDAEAICEAVQRPTMKFVATKTADQLDLQALHRVRDRLVGQRTGVINQIRAFLLERGIAVRQGPHSLRTELPGILATRTDVLLPRMLRIIEDLPKKQQWHQQTCALGRRRSVRRSAPGPVPHDEAHQVAHVEFQFPDDVLDDVSDREHAHDLASIQHWQMSKTALRHHCHAALQSIVQLNRYRLSRHHLVHRRLLRIEPGQEHLDGAVTLGNDTD